MDDKKELVMDEILIDELEEISGGSITALQPFKPRLGGVIKIPTFPPAIKYPPLSGIIQKK